MQMRTEREGKPLSRNATVAGFKADQQTSKNVTHELSAKLDRTAKLNKSNAKKKSIAVLGQRRQEQVQSLLAEERAIRAEKQGLNAELARIHLKLKALVDSGDKNLQPVAMHSQSEGGKEDSQRPANFVLTMGTHGSQLVDSRPISSSDVDITGTAPYWAVDVPGKQQREAELEGKDSLLNRISPELRKNFRQRMIDLLAERAKSHKSDSAALNQLAASMKRISSHSASPARILEGSKHHMWSGYGKVPPWDQKSFSKQQVNVKSAWDLVRRHCRCACCECSACMSQVV
mmetsp:Transcript_31225/g.100184  ORF Transcript_31225/g.100184 Transcript_31225/m.100184 type:complete len:289 (-) Transcript_31225:256-1122(-)